MAINKSRRSAVDAAMPNTLPLDTGVEIEGGFRRRRRWISQIDRVPVGVTGKAEL